MIRGGMSRSALVLLASLLFHFHRKLSAQQEVSCVVERITDGDTIACMLAWRNAWAARLPVGSQATLALDVEHRDQYGRLLAYVYRPEGRMVNAMMVRQGFAVPLVVPPNVRHVEMIRAAADSARENRIGLAPNPSETASREGCDSSYPDVCIPSRRPDLDCRDIVHRRFRVIGADPHQFDGNHDGVGCEGPQ